MLYIRGGFAVFNKGEKRTEGNLSLEQFRNYDSRGTLTKVVDGSTRSFTGSGSSSEETVDAS